MKPVKIQFFLAFAVMGAIMPFLAVYLKEDQGLTETQIGYVAAAASIAVLIAPVAITLLADTRMDPRRLIAACYLLSGTFLALLALAEGFWPTLLLFGLHSLAFVAIMPLQDGVNFSIQRKREAAGLPPPPYHQIRVWGTIGFIIPSAIIFLLIERGFTTTIILATAILFGFFGILNCRFLPDPRRNRNRPAEPADAKAWGLPTLGAARALFSGNVLVFCIGMTFIHAASSAYFAFYPLYLTEEVGVDRKWVGLIFNIGVVIEVVFIFGLGYLIRKVGLRNLILIGVFCMAARTALLAWQPTVTIAITGQIFHGLIIIALHVAPVMYINRQAADRFRNSIQGLYTMTVVGGSRIVGSILSGHLAQSGLILLFIVATFMSAITLILFLFAFREEPNDRSPF